MEKCDRRRDGRIRTRFESAFSEGRREGTGVLADISHSGARIRDVSFKPEIGKTVCIYVCVKRVSPFEVWGIVARHTDDGFAIEYPTVDAEVRRLVDDAAAILNVSNVWSRIDPVSEI